MIVKMLDWSRLKLEERVDLVVIVSLSMQIKIRDRTNRKLVSLNI